MHEDVPADEPRDTSPTEPIDADVPEADALEQRQPPIETDRAPLSDMERDADEHDVVEQHTSVDWDIDDRRDTR